MSLFLIVAKQSSTMPPDELSAAFGTLLHTLLTDGVDGDVLQVCTPPSRAMTRLPSSDQSPSLLNRTARPRPCGSCRTTWQRSRRGTGAVWEGGRLRAPCIGRGSLPAFFRRFSVRAQAGCARPQRRVLADAAGGQAPPPDDERDSGVLGWPPDLQAPPHGPFRSPPRRRQRVGTGPALTAVPNS